MVMERDIGRLEQKITDLIKSIDEFKCDMGKEVKKNTEFRLQAKGIIGFVSISCTALGAFILWILGKVFK